MHGMQPDRSTRIKNVNFAVGMAAIDGGKPTPFTKDLLDQYEDGKISAADLRKAVLNKYIGDFQ
ncbi:antitoxin VbhA family protein [Sporosarcina cyprini]|uniref:antitoxin VbhA family protein n=1 Tax=Sporosarcina cyprini TaxID=2910523 RepID=UPI001EDF1C87|nr:antitoxin VbhA family protein [Sporosarcina cyprini]MCG3088380.1 antitoxin VbhA family protein [Sporosarcina cyprini]